MRLAPTRASWLLIFVTFELVNIEERTLYMSRKRSTASAQSVFSGCYTQMVGAE